MLQTSQVAARWTGDRTLVIAAAAICALGAMLVGCGSARLSRDMSDDPRHVVRSADQLITGDEIALWQAGIGSRLRDGFDLVAALRPRFLRGDGRSGPAQLRRHAPIVYLDRVRLGDVTALRQITPREIAYIRYYTAVEARSEWGDGHYGGAIQVVRRR